MLSFKERKYQQEIKTEKLFTELEVSCSHNHQKNIFYTKTGTL